jgi:hypothetical protein
MKEFFFVEFVDFWVAKREEFNAFVESFENVFFFVYVAHGLVFVDGVDFFFFVIVVEIEVEILAVSVQNFVVVVRDPKNFVDFLVRVEHRIHFVDDHVCHDVNFVDAQNYHRVYVVHFVEKQTVVHRQIFELVVVVDQVFFDVQAENLLQIEKVEQIRFEIKEVEFV